MTILSRNIILVLFTLFLLLKISTLHATHYRAGEISYVQTDDLTIRATFTSYTKASSVQADRDSVEIDWGDGFIQLVSRDASLTQVVTGDVKISYFIATHTYPGRATYTISFTDPNRTANILNVNYPNSVDVPFYIETTFSLLDVQFEGKNSSVILLQSPIDVACVGQPFIHNPNAYDPDGDSLAYELVSPMSEVNLVVPGYVLPSEIAPGSDNQIDFDSKTGSFSWITPQIQGEYNVAFRIKEYREGVLITSMMRDMQILVQACNNTPPIIEVIPEICIIAGEQLRIDIIVNDPDVDQLVSLTATGGIFGLEPNRAIIEPDDAFRPVPYTSTLVWNSTCNDIRKESYQIVFKAIDNHTTRLVDLKILNIKVLGPPPIVENIEFEPGVIKLFWQEPYACEDAEDGFFQGFSIWRKQNGGGPEIDSCKEGIIDLEYVKIKAITKAKIGNSYFYNDDNVELHTSYCYRVLGEFARLTNVGYPYNQVQSLRSDAICATLSGDVPSIVKVSIDNTHSNQGKISLKWLPPSPQYLDTLQFPGPYRYQLTRSIYGDNDYKIINANFQQAHLTEPNIFEFSDEYLNTIDKQYNYKINFYINTNEFYKPSATASSLYLNIIPSDKILNLEWHNDVPWINTIYYIWKYNNNSLQFELFDSTHVKNYTDSDLINSKNYCYKIEAHGSYFDGIRTIDTISNYSQEVCAIPIDNLAPCPPILKIDNICNKENVDISKEELFNYLFWTDPNEHCSAQEKIGGYNIYYKEKSNETYQKLITIEGNMDRTFQHYPINGVAGCYVITSLDSIGNESIYSEEICVDNCPLYELPNTFTPNNDGYNDLFVPINNFFIEKIDFKLYNRWGTLIFETSEPEINWDGTSFSKKLMSPGVYYYTCNVFESRINSDDEESFELTGIIHLIKEK